MKVNMRAPEVLIMAGSYGYKLGDLVCWEDSFILRCLSCCFLLLAFMRSWLPFLADMMDHSACPWEDV